MELEKKICETGCVGEKSAVTAAVSGNAIRDLRIGPCASVPLIWRQVEEPSSITQNALHAVLQAALGWLDDHL
jgi:hypothetical protein